MAKFKFWLIPFIFFTLLLGGCLDNEEQNSVEELSIDILIEDVYVEMKDGIKLATRVYRPNDQNRYPVLLARTTYNSGAFGSENEGDYRDIGIRMALKGYAVVIQDVRGLHGSEGVWNLFRDDASDGYQTVVWLNEQKWSNGSVGAFGSSARGMTTNLLAIANPPGLKAALVQMAPSQFYEELIAEGGIYRHELVTRWMYGMNTTSSKKLLEQGEMDEATFNKLIVTEQEFPELYLHSPLRSFPYLSDSTLFPSIFEHYIKDEYFDYYDISSNISNIEIPIYHIGGWYDVFLEGTMKNYLRIQQHGGKGAKGQQKLLMGPGTHNNAGQYVKDGNDVNLFTEFERWFDYWLKDINTGVMDEEPIKYYTLGADEWRTTKEWPVSNVEEEKWFFNSEKSNSATSINDMQLSKVQPSVKETINYKYDPNDPILTIGGRNLFGELGVGALDQRQAEERSLTYTSEPFFQPLEIGGKVTATLYVSSDALDTDFTVNLTDVAPDGTSYLLREGALRMRFREGLNKEVLMEEGKVYKIVINLHEISHVFKAGHRMRVAVASSNFPRFDRNSNTGNPLGVDTENDYIIAENTVYFGPEHPSHITLPVIKINH